jgi:hypothetical protein
VEIRKPTTTRLRIYVEDRTARSFWIPIKLTQLSLRSFFPCIMNLHPVTGWPVRGSNPGGSKAFRARPNLPLGPPSLLRNKYWVKRPERGVDHPCPPSADERVVIHLPLWAIIVLRWNSPLHYFLIVCLFVYFSVSLFPCFLRSFPGSLFVCFSAS